MIRHLTTMVLSVALGSMFLVGSAEACHKKKCGHAAPVACAAPMPVPCAPVAMTTCAPKVKRCGFKMPKMGCKKAAACAPVMACNTPGMAGYPAYSAMPSAQH